MNDAREDYTRNASVDEQSHARPYGPVHERRLVRGIQVVDVAPSWMPGTEEYAWKLLVQFPWSRFSDLLYLPQTARRTVPTAGPHDFLLERGARRMGTPGTEETHFTWKLVEMDPAAGIAENGARAVHKPPEAARNPAGHADDGAVSAGGTMKPSDAPGSREGGAPPGGTPPVGDAHNRGQEASSQTSPPGGRADGSGRGPAEREASERACTALNASARMVSGYLSSASRHQRDYTWRDMVDIAVAVADAFVDWLDDATMRQLGERNDTIAPSPRQRAAAETVQRIAEEHLRD